MRNKYHDGKGVSTLVGVSKTKVVIGFNLGTQQKNRNHTFHRQATRLRFFTCASL